MCQARQSTPGHKTDKAALVSYCNSNLKREDDIYQTSRCLKGLGTDLMWEVMEHIHKEVRFNIIISILHLRKGRVHRLHQTEKLVRSLLIAPELGFLEPWFQHPVTVFDMPRREIKRQAIMWMFSNKGEPLPCVDMRPRVYSYGELQEIHENQRVMILRTAEECSPLSETCTCAHVHTKNSKVSWAIGFHHPSPGVS